MKAYSRNPRLPITLDRLVEICTAMKEMDRKECFEFGKQCGISKNNVDAIRQMLGYSDSKTYSHTTAEEREKIVDEYREGGISMCELARKHGLAYNSVHCLITNRDVTITTSKAWTRRQELFLLNELKKNTPTRKIAELMGKKQKSVQHKIIRMKRNEKIIEENKRGTPVSEIAKKLNLEESNVKEIMKKLKINKSIKEDNDD